MFGTCFSSMSNWSSFTVAEAAWLPQEHRRQLAEAGYIGDDEP